MARKTCTIKSGNDVRAHSGRPSHHVRKEWQKAERDIEENIWHGKRDCIGLSFREVPGVGPLGDLIAYSVESCTDLGKTQGPPWGTRERPLREPEKRTDPGPIAERTRDANRSETSRNFLPVYRG